MNEPLLKQLEEAGTVRETLLYERLPDNYVRCLECQRLCRVADGKEGFCRTKLNRSGTLLTTIYGLVSSANADPIEKKPVYHYKPASLVFSLGSLGCNFRCPFCQNWEIAYANPDSLSLRYNSFLSPEDAVDLARRTRSRGLAWTYNEPSIWLNYTLDCARLARQSGLYSVYVTNGFATREHIDTIGPHLDVYRVDIKSLENSFYQRLMKVPGVDGILETTRYAKDKWGMHVEVVTNVIPTWNDREDNFKAIARWIVSSLGDLTPWHLTRFFPHAQFSDLPPTPIETLENALAIGKTEGLKFVYLGNTPSSSVGTNTYCPRNGELAVARSGYHTEVVAVTETGRCPYDGADLNIVM